MDRFGPTGKFRKKRSTFWGGPLFSVRPVRSKWTVPFDHSILNPRTSLFGIFHVQNGGKYSSLHFYGLLTADLSVLLVHPCTHTTGLKLLRKRKVCFGCWRLLKTLYFPREFGMFFSSFDSNVVFQVIWQISGNCLLKITHFIYFFDRERAVSWESCNLIDSGRGQYFPISWPRSRQRRETARVKLSCSASFHEWTAVIVDFFPLYNSMDD